MTQQHKQTITMKTVFAIIIIKALVIAGVFALASCSVSEPVKHEASLTSVITEVYEEDSVLVIGYKDIKGGVSEIVVELDLPNEHVYYVEINGVEYKVVYWLKGYTGETSNAVSINGEFWRI